MIPFSPPHINQEAIDEVIDTLKSGWITTGPKTKKFESELTEYCGNKSTLCVNSATFGLELVLRWFGVGPGDEVIIPAYTYSATANVVVHTGATPVMADINSSDFNISVAEIEKKISEKTKVIIPVDIAGLPADYEAIGKLVCKPEIIKIFNPTSDNQKKLGRILILSDAAHSFGATCKGKKTGNLTDITVFSFHAVKNLTTAEGGAIALNLDAPFDCFEEYKHFNTMSLHGQNKDALAKTQKGGWRYDIVDAGFKGNMTDIQSSLGLIALKYYDSENLPVRKEIFNTYSKGFSSKKWAELPIGSDYTRETSYHLYTLRIRDITENQRDQIIQLIFEQEISVNVHFIPLPLHSAYKSRGYEMKNYPVSYDNYSREISLPVYQDLSLKNVNYIVETIVKIVDSFLKS
ncbi:MAG: DegT/DnrJ/EryC1/StrS aminotransferase family protein [Bacteroidales bacterium]